MDRVQQSVMDVQQPFLENSIILVVRLLINVKQGSAKKLIGN